MYSLSAEYGSRTKVIGPAMLMFTFALGFASNSFGATLSVLSYGAAGSGLTDDNAAIQKASDASSAGIALLFPAGNAVTQPLTAHSTHSQGLTFHDLSITKRGQHLDLPI
jgi:hypothetical protein